MVCSRTKIILHLLFTPTRRRSTIDTENRTRTTTCYTGQPLRADDAAFSVFTSTRSQTKPDKLAMVCNELVLKMYQGDCNVQ